MMTPLAFACDYIFRWENGQQTDPAETYSMRPADPGNWSTGIVNKGDLIGSNHGVTPIALAASRKMPVSAITVYAVRLDRLRTLPESRELLAEIDVHGLLDGGEAAALAPVDGLDDEALLAELGIDAETAENITRLRTSARVASARRPRISRAQNDVRTSTPSSRCSIGSMPT